MHEEKQAKKEAERVTEDLVLSTDGLKKEEEWVECAVVQKAESWEKRRTHLSQQKPIFTEEIYAMSEAVMSVEFMCR